MPASNPPEKSSRLPWTYAEDERLYHAVLELTLKFPGRSVPAVLSRIWQLRVFWWRRLDPKRNKK